MEINKEKTAIIIFNNKINIWEDKTQTIFSINKHFSNYEIIFNNNKQNPFTYNENRVKIVNILGTFNLKNKDVYVDGKLEYAEKVEILANGMYRIHLNNKIKLSRRVELKSNSSKAVFNYFRKLALFAESIAEEEEPLLFLARKYRQIELKNESVLTSYLDGECKEKVEEDPLLAPFSYNLSQFNALKTALTHNISVIEGPPGTGKTQTIINLIANILCRGKSCAVISNNNTAISNVYEKLEEEGISFVAASLGSRDNVSAFFDSDDNTKLTEFLDKDIDLLPKNYKKQLASLEFIGTKIKNTEIELAKLEEELRTCMVERSHHIEELKHSRKIRKNLNSSDCLKIILRLEAKEKIGLINKIKLSSRLKINLFKQDINSIIDNLEALFYPKRISEIADEIKVKEEYLKVNNKDKVDASIKSLSKTILLTVIKNHYKQLKEEAFTQENYKDNYELFLNRYPLVLSTSHSLINNLPRGYLFDYLIIDEASQGDLLSSILPMSCAKNLVVVGDSKQLQEIGEERLYPEASRLETEMEIPEEYKYKNNSILKSVVTAVENCPTTMLREHYRSAPDIINFCNKMFYQNELIPMTKNSCQHIEIIKTVPGNHARKNTKGSGLYNQREIDEICNLTLDLEGDKVGVITPFRYQAELIRERLSEKNIEADTIHKYQGRQKDTVILSFVVNSLEKNPQNVENRLYDFVTNEKLLNVAISRAKEKVIAVISDEVYNSKNNIISDFIHYAEYLYGNNVTKVSTITSIFDYLYSKSNEEIKEIFAGNNKQYKTEILMCSLIDQVIKDKCYIGYSIHTRLSKLVKNLEAFSKEEKLYLQHPWAHVDFLFYNRVSNLPLFVLEVDGVRYHEQNNKQLINDNIKDRALAVNDIPIFRFKTNESKELERLDAIIQKYIY